MNADHNQHRPRGKDETCLTEALKDLRTGHATLEARIEELNRALYLSCREQMEQKRLKKLKLATKDQIVRLEMALTARTTPNA